MSRIAEHNEMRVANRRAATALVAEGATMLGMGNDVSQRMRRLISDAVDVPCTCGEPAVQKPIPQNIDCPIEPA